MGPHTAQWRSRSPFEGGAVLRAGRLTAALSSEANSRARNRSPPARDRPRLHSREICEVRQKIDAALRAWWPVAVKAAPQERRAKRSQSLDGDWLPGRHSLRLRRHFAGSGPLR